MINTRKNWWILCGVVAVLLIVGIWAFFTYGPVNRVLSAREAEAYRVYDITLPEGESSAFSYILSQCTAEEEQYQADALVITAYVPKDTLKNAFSQCQEILSVELLEVKNSKSVDILYKGTEGEEVNLVYGEDGTLLIRVVYFPQRDTMVEYNAESGKTRMQRPFRKNG